MELTNLRHLNNFFTGKWIELTPLRRRKGLAPDTLKKNLMALFMDGVQLPQACIRNLFKMSKKCINW